jgi:hypothetical protein
MRLVPRSRRTVLLLTAAALGGAACAGDQACSLRDFAVYAAFTAAPFIPAVIAGYLEDRRALRAGMVRPRRGVTVRFRGGAIEVRTPPRPITALFIARRVRERGRVDRVPIAAVRRAVFVRDNLLATPSGLDMALNIEWGDANTLRVQSMADGFDELMTWARANVPFDVRVVELGA